MNFDLVEAITKRISTRSFSSLTIPTEKQKLMIHYTKQQIKGPFGTSVTFNWVDMNHFSKTEVKKFGSFGIKNPSSFFVVGSVLFSDYNIEDFGYLLEKIVLYATHIDLSSCWLSPFFNQQAFSEIIGIDSTQSIPAVVMIGLPSEKKTFSDKTMRFLIKAETRKPFHKVFFESDFQTLLDCSKKSKYLLAMEMVRKAPSFMNRQPWRIVKNKHEKTFHFYLQHPKIEVSDIDSRLLRIDIGIAMAHFYESMAQLGYPGMWSINNPQIKLPNQNLEYIVTWTI